MRPTMAQVGNLQWPVGHNVPLVVPLETVPEGLRLYSRVLAHLYRRRCRFGVQDLFQRFNVHGRHETDIVRLDSW